MRSRYLVWCLAVFALAVALPAAGLADAVATDTTAQTDEIFATDASTATSPTAETTVEGEPVPLPIPTLSQWAVGTMILLLATCAVAWLSLRKDLQLPELGDGPEID